LVKVTFRERGEGFRFDTAKRDREAFSYCGADVGKGIGGFEKVID